MTRTEPKAVSVARGEPRTSDTSWRRWLPDARPWAPPVGSSRPRGTPVHPSEFKTASGPSLSAVRELQVQHRKAPDGSEIRELSAGKTGSLCHCRLPAGHVTSPVRHQTVEEIWFCTAGAGHIWMKKGDKEEVIEILPGRSVTIPTGAAFQFRSSRREGLEVLITTMPPWPGPTEAQAAEGPWKSSYLPAHSNG